MKTICRFAVAAVVAALLTPLAATQLHAQGAWVYFGAPAKARLRVENYSGGAVRVYAVNPWGGWMWAADVGNGSETVLSTPAGFQWVVTDRRNSVLRKFMAKPGTSTVTLGSRAPVMAPPQRMGEITFKNRLDHPVYLYKVNTAGAWIWEGMLRPGQAFEGRTIRDHTWVVTNLRGRILLRVPGTNRERTIVIER